MGPVSPAFQNKMVVYKNIVLLVTMVVMVSGKKNTKSFTETDDAYILDVNLPKKSAKNPTTRLLSSGNPAIDGAVVGLGVGILGSLLLSKLQDQKKCNPRGRRDTASTRFLPGILDSADCQPGYNQQQYQSGYNQPYNSGYNQQYQSGYIQPSNPGYNHPYNQGYNQQYQSGNNQPYRPAFNQPISGYRPPSNGYRPQNSGYNGYNQVPDLSNSYGNPYNQGYTQSRAHKPTPAPFSHGLPPRSRRSRLTKSTGYYPGILN